MGGARAFCRRIGISYRGSQLVSSAWHSSRFVSPGRCRGGGLGRRAGGCARRAPRAAARLRLDCGPRGQRQRSDGSPDSGIVGRKSRQRQKRTYAIGRLRLQATPFAASKRTDVKHWALYRNLHSTGGGLSPGKGARVAELLFGARCVKARMRGWLCRYFHRVRISSRLNAARAAKNKSTARVSSPPPSASIEPVSRVRIPSSDVT